jgi:hypothetical protein
MILAAREAVDLVYNVDNTLKFVGFRLVGLRVIFEC